MAVRSNLCALPAIILCAALAVSGCHQPAADNDDGQTIALAALPEYTPAEKAAIQATFPAPYNTADLAAGEKQFNKCRTCHTITPDGMNLTGPHLYGVFGRKAASATGYTFSEAMHKHDVVWDFDTLDVYLAAPQQVVKGTKMGYPGVKDAVDRRNLIAYLKLEATPRAITAPASGAAASSQ